MNIIDPRSPDGRQMISNSAHEQPLTQGDPPPDAEALYDTLRRWLPQELLDRYIAAGTIVLDADQERAALITALEYWRGRAEWADRSDALGDEVLALKGVIAKLEKVSKT